MRKNDEHDEGTVVLTPEALMDLAFKKYQTRDTKKLWKAKSKEEQEIVNLTAQLKKSDIKFNDKFKKGANKKKPTPKSSKGDNNGFTAKRKERFEKAPAWMKKNPQAGFKTMKHEGDTFHWCAHHKLWQKHKTKDCQMGKGSKPAASKAAKPKVRFDRQPDNTNNDKLVLDNNLAQLAFAAKIDKEW
jgi:hypothetical protein